MGPPRRPRPGLHFEDRSWSWGEVIEQSLIRAAAVDELVDRDRPPHLGVLLDNVPEYVFWLGGAALAGATIVGANPTRRGADLARDIAHTDCQALITDGTHRDLVRDSLTVPVVDQDEHLLESTVERPDLANPEWLPVPDTNLLLMFTSGSTSAPKAVPCSNGRAGSAGARVAAGNGIGSGDVVYCPMPFGFLIESEQ